MRPVYIYMLICPISNEVKYVGKTIRLEKRKLEPNMRKNKKRLSNVDEWENTLISNGLKPIFEIIETCDEESWVEKEVYWIKKLKLEGKSLLNMTNGGDSVNRPITINHNSNHLKGKKLEDYYNIDKSNEIRLKISKSSSGVNNPNYGGIFHTEEYLEKQSISNSKHPIIVTDFINKVSYKFINSKKAAEFINCQDSVVRHAKRMGYKIKKQFIITDAKDPSPTSV